MNRALAKQKDDEIRKYLVSFATERRLDSYFANKIMDEYLEIVPDESKKDIIFIGGKNASYKLGNIKLDLKNVMLALLDFVSAINKPDSLFDYVQLVIISAMCVGAMSKKELSYNCAVILSMLHERNAYEIGMTEDVIQKEILDKINQGFYKEYEKDKFELCIDSLLKWNVIRMEEEKIYLNETVWGKVE